MEGLADAALEDGECFKDSHWPWCPSGIDSMSLTFYLLRDSY